MAARDFRARLQKRATRAGLSITSELSSAIAVYFDLLSRWNRKINLTALDDPDQAIDRLVLEPLLAARYLPSGSLRVMDIGSGGGSPAIPLKLAAPSVALTMVEVKARKSAFLREAVRTLDLRDVHVETSRYEELLARPELHEVFDVLTVRAVRVEPRILHTLQAFLRPSGSLFMFRGPSGPETPSDVFPPLEFHATYPLVDSVQSRLTVLTKRPVGAAVNVPRGTLPAR